MTYNIRSLNQFHREHCRRPAQTPIQAEAGGQTPATRRFNTTQCRPQEEVNPRPAFFRQSHIESVILNAFRQKRAVQIPLGDHATIAYVPSLRKRFLPDRSALVANLAQFGVVGWKFNDFTPGAFSLEAQSCHKRPRRTFADRFAKHSLARPVRQFLGFDTISVTQDTVNQFAVQGLAVRGQPAMEFGQLFLIAFHPAGNHPLMPSRFDPALFSDPIAVGVSDPPGRLVVIRVVQPPLSLNRPLQPGDFSFLVGNIGSKQFQTGVGITDKGDCGRANVQAHIPLADYLVRLLVRPAFIDQLSIEPVAQPDRNCPDTPFSWYPY